MGVEREGEEAGGLGVFGRGCGGTQGRDPFRFDWEEGLNFARSRGGKSRREVIS
jgi:hypothetical protein